MGTNCATLVVADLFLYCYESDFVDNQADDIEAFNSTSRYLDDLLNIYNPYFILKACSFKCIHLIYS